MWTLSESDCASLGKLATSAGVDVPANIIKRGCISSDEFQSLRALFSHTNAPLFAWLAQLKLQPPEERPAPSAEYLARVERLRRQQEDRSLQPAWARKSDMPSFGAELREANRQLMTVVNMVITVVSAFAFGYYAVAFANPRIAENLVIRAVIGLFLATVVFIADIYFVLKQVTTSDEHMNKLKKKTN